MTTPYFPSWRRKLAAAKRTLTHRPKPSPVDIEIQCGSFLSARALEAPADGPRRRRRVFFLSRVFWCFLWQVLQPHTSCRAVVRHVQAFYETERTAFDESTSAYCQARDRLPIRCLQQALHDSAQAADRLALRGVPGWTRPIKVVDGSSVRLPDTVANRKAYPYPSGQRPGCGFPVMQFCGLYSLRSGAILNTIQSPWSAHEVPLLRALAPELQTGDILLGDRAFGAYTILALLTARWRAARPVGLRCRRGGSWPIPGLAPVHLHLVPHQARKGYDVVLRRGLLQRIQIGGPPLGPDNGPPVPRRG